MKAYLIKYNTNIKGQDGLYMLVYAEDFDGAVTKLSEYLSRIPRHLFSKQIRLVQYENVTIE
jgi:hypothetical protein